jgi:RimJ/RimL family protein N-acetyltransferase
LLHDGAPSSAVRGELRVGYLVAERHWGNGFASELLSGLITWARAAEFASIVAGVTAANVASIRVLEKCGLTQVEDEGPNRTELFYVVNL